MIRLLSETENSYKGKYSIIIRSEKHDRTTHSKKGVTTIYKLLISDRDKQELLGIQWLISKYSFPVTTIKVAGQVGEVIDELENELPDILCIELDMIPEGKWEMVKSHIHQYTEQIIAITAEATFERAMQAMSVKAVDLWVKPLSPSRVKNSLQQAVRNLELFSNPTAITEVRDDSRYESLFIDDQTPFLYPVYLLETEFMADLDYLRKFIKQFDFYCDPVLLSTRDRIVLVFNQSFPSQFKQAQRFLREWENIVGRPLTIVVHEQNEEESLHQIYLKLLKVMETTFFTGYKQVLKAKRTHSWQAMDPFLTMEEQRNWVFMLDEGNGDAIKKWMYEDFFDIEAPYPEPGLLRTRLTSILAQVRRFMIRKGLNNSEETYKKVFDSILYSPVLYRIVQDIILFLNDLFQMMGEQDIKVDVVEAAIAYIETHYSNSNLTLTEVAKHVNRSPSYFSHLLSEKYKQTFSEMLLYIRIEKAKELLGTTDDAIQNISESIGFNNPNYFSRVFKTCTGKTPREWRL